jgi:hypothetical protein
MTSEFDYSKVDLNVPSYKYLKINQVTGGQTVTTTSAGGSESLFEIPVGNSFNLAKSYLNFIRSIPGQGAANRYSWSWADLLADILQIQIYTKRGYMINDINFLPHYTRMVQKIETPFTETRSNDNYVVSVTATAPNGVSKILACCEQASNGRPSRIANADYGVNYVDCRYFDVSASNAAYVKQSSIEGKHIKNSILAYDKDIWFPEPVIIRIVWNASSKIAFKTDGVGGDTNITIGTAVLDVDTITYSEVYFMLAVEQNLEAVNMLKNKVMNEGLIIPIDYVKPNKYVHPAATNQNVSLKFSRIDGVKLEKVYHSLFNATETTSSLYDNIETTLKLTDFYTTIDNQRRQDSNLRMAYYEDYNLLKPMLNGSTILDSNIYRYNWCFVDDFTNDVDQNGNIISGLDLSLEKKWDFNSNHAAATSYIHVTFAVLKKMLKISKDEITFV